MDSSAYFRGVEHLWLLWLFSAIGVAWATIRTFSGVDWVRFVRFLRSEHGAAYSFAYVMTFPLYVLMIVVVVQTTMMLMTHMGVVYAAYCGCRAAIVYTPIDGGKQMDQANRKIRQAVVAALTPFASSSDFHARQMEVPPTSTEANDYYDTYIAFLGADKDKTGGTVKKTYLTAKYRFAAGAKVTIIKTEVPDLNSSSPWTQDVKVTVTYNCPFDLPVVPRFLGRRPWSGADFFVLPMKATVGLQYEVPKSDARTLGIPDPFKPAE